MARSLVLANGEMHVGLNNFGEVSDLYYPYVGSENHLSGRNLRHRVGIWVDGTISWLDEDGWAVTTRYHDHSMVGHTDANNAKLGVRLEFDDCVDSYQAAFLRNIHIINHHGKQREIRLYMHQAFDISNSRGADTATYLPKQHALLHFKGQRAFIVNALHAGKQPFDDFTIGLSDISGQRTTHKDADDGALAKLTAAHGRGESIIALHCHVGAHSSTRIHYWLVAGKSIADAIKINDRIVSNGFHSQVQSTTAYWRDWLRTSAAATKKLGKVETKAMTDSLFVIKAHIDKRGAVMSSLDTTVRDHSRDSYAFCWPREACYALWPLMRLGYTDEVLQFFTFCKRVMHEDGYLAHKYQADGAIGSLWHPYNHTGSSVEQPIATDETASVVFLFGQYFRQHDDVKLLKEFYAPVIAKMAHFLASYVGDNHLPLASYDIWDERFITSTYTTAVTYAALIEASELADASGAKEDAVRWRSAAEDMKNAASELYNSDKKYFYRGIIPNHRKTPEYDDTIDAASLYGAFMYGLFEVDSNEIATSLTTAKKVLRNMAKPEAFTRFENDSYHRLNKADESNVWPMVSLWFAQFALESDDTKGAEKILTWAIPRDNTMIAEQVDPHHFERVSASPLVWAHAELASTLLDSLSEPEASGV